VIDEIRQRLSLYRPNALAEDGRSRAAVLIPLYFKRGELHVVLTKRGELLGSHSGEISFPGGGREQSDRDLMVTALRECYEEIGLRPDDVEIIGRMDDLVTVSNYHVTPFVGEIDPAVCPYDWCCQETEVAEILEVPLAHLLDPTNLTEVTRTRQNGETVTLEAFLFNNHVIWGATGRMLRNFLDAAVTHVAGPEYALRDGFIERR
jgi:8-oxo-dGTP pyrophosphatase MutT (NUDIX family)